MSKRTTLIALCALALIQAGALAQETPNAAPSTPPVPDAPIASPAALPAPTPTGPQAIFDTSMGRISCRLFDKEAPVATANFIGLAEGTKDWTDPATRKKMHRKPLYNGTTFHRVIPGFMIQGGDPTASGTGDPGYYFNDEFSPNLNFDVPGRLAMANSGPNTNGSQFFITELPYPSLDQHYTIFGTCDEPGVSVVSAITHVQRDSDDKPLQPVTLDKVTIVREGQPVPPAPPVAPTQAPAATPQPSGSSVGAPNASGADTSKPSTPPQQ